MSDWDVWGSDAQRCSHWMVQQARTEWPDLASVSYVSC